MKQIKKPVSVLLTLIMVLGLFTVVPFTVGALDGVSYIDENGEAQTANGVTAVTSGTTTFSAGWYAVTSNVTNSNRITCNGDVHLILCNDTTLTAHKGITVSGDDNSLTIYQQAEAENAETGKLIIDQVDEDYAGIGGDNGGFGGYSDGFGENITINGGYINVSGGDYGAGIGGGVEASAENITINGGIVNTSGGEYAAGIGGGMDGSAENITINGGVITANGGDYAAGIGGDYEGIGGSITLSWTNKTDSIYASSYSGTVTLLKPFCYGGTIFDAGEISDNNTLANKTLRPFSPACSGHSISLNGDIGLNYYLYVHEGAHLYCEWYNKTFDHTVTAADYDAVSGYYKVEVNMAAAEMTCPVTATLTDGADTATDVYSVRDYADVILDSESDFSVGYVAANGAGKYAALVDLIKKTLDFGAKAQTRFGVTDYVLANQGIDYTMQPATVYHIKTKKTEMEDPELYKYGLSYIGTSVLFLSGTTLRHNYTVTDDYLLRQIKDTANFDFVDKGYRVCFERKNIPAVQLDVDFTFTLGESTYRYSVLDYCKLVIADESKPQADRELAMATFWYNDAAKTYFYYSDEYEDTIV